MQLKTGETYEPFVAGHYRCCICGEDVPEAGAKETMNLRYMVHFDCEEGYDDDLGADYDPEYD